MSDPALLDQLAKLNAEVQNIESRFGQGQVPAATLEAIKCALDEVRLRLWGLLQSKSGESPETFAQRFRMRRTPIRNQRTPRPTQSPRRATRTARRDGRARPV